MIRGVSPSRRFGSERRRNAPSMVLQGSTGSVTVTGDTNDDIPMQQLGKLIAIMRCCLGHDRCIKNKNKTYWQFFFFNKEYYFWAKIMKSVW